MSRQPTKPTTPSPREKKDLQSQKSGAIVRDDVRQLLLDIRRGLTQATRSIDRYLERHL